MADATTGQPAPGLLRPDWPAPANVRAAVSLRSGGISQPPYQSQNLAQHVGDDPQAVAHNRQQLQAALALPEIQWLEQIHGTELTEARPDKLVRTADGCFTRQTGLACAVLTADCLPILLCDQQGRQVAAVHAGWRGLAGGIVAQAVDQFDAAPDQLLAWLGPAIGPAAFEVGVEVLESFFELAHNPAEADAIGQCFKPGLRPLRFHADLFALTRFALAQQGVSAVYGGGLCTYADAQRFYSYRREPVTGRLASLIWLA